MSSRDIVVFGSHPFVLGVPLGDWHVTRALAKRHRVLWVDPPASPLAPLRGVASRGMFRPRPRQVDARLFVGSPVVHSGRARPTAVTVVDRLITAQVNRWIRELGMSDVDVISFAPRLGGLTGVRRRVLAAWLKDRDWAADGVSDPLWLRRRQAELVRHADVVTAVSNVLVADCRDLGVDALRIPNGCDPDHFAGHRPEPEVLRGIPRPRVVFSGAWNPHRVDRDLVSGVAAALPGFSFLVVGRAHRSPPRASNIHHIGAVDYAELPAFLQASDVGIVPYRDSPFNAASCPLKVYEYLAAGLPVVVSNVDVADLPAELARRADDCDAFAAAIGELAGRDVRAACRAIGAASSWDERADAVLAALDRCA